MLPNRLLLLAALAVALTLVACGGGDDDEEEMVIPEGTHHGYVVSKVSVVPAPPNMPTDPGYGLDLGSRTSSALDGRINNNLGMALTSLSGIEGLNPQATLTTAVNEGNIILLVDFQSKDFMNSNAGFSIKFGANPNPMACSDDTDMDCGRHLMGGASFQLASNSPGDALVTGKLENGAFEGGPGTLALQLTIADTTPILLPLVRARVKITSVSETSLKALVAGLIPAADFKTNVGGALETAVAGLFAADCTQISPPNPPSCGCTGLAEQLMKALDIGAGSAGDCRVSADEILAFPLTSPYTTPDVCSMKTCSAADAISVGVNIEAVAATFPM